MTKGTERKEKEGKVREKGDRERRQRKEIEGRVREKGDRERREKGK